MCWLAEAFKGRFGQELSRHVCTALGANALEAHVGLGIARQALLAAGPSFTGRGQGDASHRGLHHMWHWSDFLRKERLGLLVPSKRHLMWMDSIDLLQGWFLKDEESFGFLETFANNEVTLTLYYLQSISSMTPSRCWLLSCLSMWESGGSLHGCILCHQVSSLI